MILDRIQHYLSIAFFTVLIITQALVFVGVNASNEGDFLQVVFIEPLSENIDIGNSVYFQAMIADQEDKNYDLVYFNLKNLNIGLDENYQASLQDDGTWIAQNIWDTNNYSVGQYYISVVAHNYDNNSVEDIYYSQNQLINLNGSYEMMIGGLGDVYFQYPVSSTVINLELINSLTAVLYVDNDTNATISEIQFKLLKDNGDNEIAFNFDNVAITTGPVPDNLNYTAWEASIDLLDMEPGEYMISAEASGDSDIPSFVMMPTTFTIVRIEDNSLPGDLSINPVVISPVGSTPFSMQDTMDIYIESTLMLSDSAHFRAEIKSNSGDFVENKVLAPDPNNDGGYFASVDFDEHLAGDDQDQDSVNLEGIYSPGKYIILFYFVSHEGTISVGRAEFDIGEVISEELVYEIIDNNSLAGSLVEGDYLELDFETTWEVENGPFSFSIIKDGEPTVGFESIVPLVTGGFTWQYSISAEENGLTNGTYILRADADDPDGNTVNLGPIAFEWQITEEDEVIIPSLVMHLEDPNLGPGDILIGSGNIPGAEFILENTTDEDDRHSLGPSLVNCSASNMINSNIQELTEDLGHGDCYYYILREEDNLANYINYDVYLQKELSDGEIVYSNKPTATYFDEDNQDFELLTLPEEVILRIYKPDLLDDQDISFVVFSNWETPVSLEVGPFIVWENKDTGELFYNGLQIYSSQSDQDVIPLVSFIDEMRPDNSDAINVYLAPDVNYANFPNGEYFVYAGYNNPVLNNIESENRLSISINNEDIEIISEEDTIFDLYAPQIRERNGNTYLSFPLLTKLSGYNLDLIQFSVFKAANVLVDFNGGLSYVGWEELESFDISEADKLGITMKQLYEIQIKDEYGNIIIEDGDYYVYGTMFGEDFQTERIYFSIQENTLIIDQTNSDQNEKVQDETSPEEEQAEESVDLVIDYYSTCIDQGIVDQETCMQFRATMDLLNQACIEQGIYEALACEDYLYRMEADLECQENNIIDGEECKNYLLEKYGSQVDCQLEDINLCNNILRNEYLSRLVVEQKLSQNINQAVDDLLGKNISTQDLNDALEAGGVVGLDVLPLVPDQSTRVLLARAQKETVLEEKDKLTILNQAVIILDADGDGLSDDLELYYGTEINNSDTDGDGYSDGEEIKNGYDPLGPGSLIKERTNFDLVTLDDEKIIEQPKVKSKKIDKKMEVENIDVSEEKLSLSGKAAANTWVNLYLYSGLPLVMTTKTDASGNWSYDIKNSLTDGHHRVFVTINDDTGKIVKQSRPISFLIKEAKAVTSNDYFDESSSSAAINNLFIYYILGGAFLVFLALGVIVYLHKGKNKNLEI